MNKQSADKTLFLRTISEGDSFFDSQTVARLAEQVGIPLADTNYCCIVVRYADGEKALADMQMPSTLLAACRETVRKMKMDITCYLGSHLYVVMVVIAPAEKKSFLIAKLLQDITKRCGEAIQLGVGRSYGELEKLSYSRVEAYEALSTLRQQDSVCYIDDIYVSRSITARKAEGQKRRILELFKSGQLEKMTEKMAKLAEDVRSESPVREDAPYPTSIRRTILEVLFQIMHIAADAGVDVDKLMEYQDPYSRVFETGGSTPELLRWLSEVAEKLYDGISERHSRTENNMLAKAKRCIEEHLTDPELSLSVVSDVLGITPTYFSAFFIQEVGVGFNEYITGLRIERAKQLLTGTNQKISQIAEECGFRSASYFIVVFRKQTGMSPGEFRKN